LDVDPEANPYFDASMGINKTKLLRPKRMNFQFVEEGKWSRDAETIKLKVYTASVHPLLPFSSAFPFYVILFNCLVCDLLFLF